MLDFCAILNHNTQQQDSTTDQLASSISKDMPPNSSSIPCKSTASPTSINLQDKDHNSPVDFKMLDFSEIVNHNTPKQDSFTNQSASTISKDTSNKTSTIPCKSSACPKPIHLQGKDNKPPTFQRNSFQPTTQAKRKPKNTLPNKSAVPAKNVNNSLRKCSLQKQDHLKKTSNTSVRSHAAHTNPSLYKQPQERFIIPQVSRLRTPAISYSSAVSGTNPETPSNRLALTNQMVPSSTNTNFSNMNQQSVMTHVDPPTFCLPISEYPQLTGKSQTVPSIGSPSTGSYLLTSAQLPNSIEELRENILSILSPHPNGMSLFQLQNTYRTTFKHKIPLNGYKNVKQLLEEMKEEVKVERTGIQDWVSLISPDAVSTELVEEFGLHNEHACEASRQDIAINTPNLNGLESSPRDEDQHEQADAKDLLHNLSGIKKSQNIADAILNSCNTSQSLENTVLSIKNPNIILDTPVTNGTANQMPVSTLQSTQTSLQKQINAIDDSSEHLLEGNTICTNSHLPEVHHKAQIAKSQITENSYSSISPTVVTSSSSPLSEPPTALLSSMKPLSTVASHSATQLTVSTSDQSNFPAEVQHGPPYMENIGIISDSSFERLKEMRELKSNIVTVLNQQPDGMTVFQLKKLYSFMFQHGLPLHGHSSVKQLLMAMPDAAKLRGLGVQMLVFPFSSEMHCSSLITEDNGFSLLEMENGTFPTIQDVAHTSTTSELPAMCTPGNDPLDPEAPTFSPSSPLFSDQFPSLQPVAVISPLPLDSSRESDLSPSHCQTLTSDTAFTYTVDNDNDVPIPGSMPTTHLSKFNGKAANSPSRLVCLKEQVDSLQRQNGRVNSAQQLTYSIINHQDISSSHEEEFHDDEWPALSKDLFAPSSNKKTCTDLIPLKINKQDPRTIVSNSSRARAAVKFVVVSDACNVKDVNTESYFFGNSSEIPTFGSVVFPLLGSQQSSPVALIKKSHSVQNYSREKRHNEIEGQVEEPPGKSEH